MGTLVGRDAELTRCRAVFDSAAKGYVRAIRVVGMTGAGKTALGQEAADGAQRQGWLVAETPSFRIHAGLPLFTARRAMQSLLEALGSEAPRYESGLVTGRDQPEAFEEAFLRLIEGITLDHRLVLLMDDAQWADAQSRSLISSTLTALADRAIVLLSTERSDEAVVPAFELVDETVPLGALSRPAAAAVVRAVYPDVTDDVAQTIAGATRGHAVDVIAVATAARESGARTVRDVTESTARIVARDLALLDPQTRTFLQLCALIEDPIDLPLLQQLFAQETILAAIDRLSNRYLVADAEGLRFTHAAILESVRQTIPMEIPLRFRIIEGLRKLPSPRLEDYERLARQLAACGDREGEREALTSLADASLERGLPALALDAYERAIVLRRPSGAEIKPIYQRITQLYNMLGREDEAIRACSEMLAQVPDGPLEDGMGAIAASMVIAMSLAGRVREARETLAQYESRVSSAGDRGELFSAAMYFAVAAHDDAEFARFRALFESAAPGAGALSILRGHIATSYKALTAGEETAALEAMAKLQTTTEKFPAFASVPRAVRLMQSFRYRGIEHAELEASASEAGNDLSYHALRPHLMIARGELSDAIEFSTQRLASVHDALARRMLLGALGAALFFSDVSPADPLWRPVAHEAQLFATGREAASLWPIAAAWNAATARSTRDIKRQTMDRLLSVLEGGLDWGTIHYPAVLSVIARSLDDRALLEHIAAQGVGSDRQPWNLAHADLARYLAAATLRQNEAPAHLDRLAQTFTTLGAPFFAEMARAAGAGAVVKSTSKNVANTTRREREIAAIVAEGLTNRQIAEKLVLSERTVEGHIANLFAKVQVNSRTQLAAWYLKIANSVA